MGALDGLSVTEVPLAKLRPAPRNANELAPETLAKIRASIKELGVVENLVVRPLTEGGYSQTC